MTEEKDEQQGGQMPKWVQRGLIALVILLFLGILLTIVLSLIIAFHQ